MRSQTLRRELSQHYAALQELLIECLPDERGVAASHVRVYAAWSRCVAQLQVLRMAL